MREGGNGGGTRGVNTGGGLTMNQLGKFMYFMYHKTDAEIPPGFIVLDEKNKSLNNDTFAVFYNPENVHLIAVHRGTNLKSISDIGNNIRNLFFTETDSLITKRNRVAKDGHLELKKHLIHMYKQKAKIDPIFSGIIQFIENALQGNPQNLEYAVTHFLRNKLTTIGHSQGAVYAYLYGDQGFETIVFNPSPYKGCKPVNTYLIRNKGDFVSYFTKLKNKDKDIKNSKIFHNYVKDEKMSKHSTKSLFNDFRRIGNPLLMNRDLDKPIRNKTRKSIHKKSKGKKSISKKPRS
jgi:hypothetical protein